MNLPNKLTLTRIILIPFMLIFMLPLPVGFLPGWNTFSLRYGMIIALIIFSLASYTDHLDGSIARKNNIVTNLGKFLDPIADKLLILSAFTAFVQLNRISSWVPIIILFREFSVTGVRLLGIEQGKVIASAYVGKLKMVFQIIAILALMLENILSTFISAGVFLQIFSILTNLFVFATVILTLVSGIDYVIKNKNLLHN